MNFGEELESHVAALREGPAFTIYQHVRERVLQMKELEAERHIGVYEPSDYWREELANFDYMLDASPLIISKLRHHTYHITGLRVYDYRTNKDEARKRFVQKLHALQQLGGEALLVPEAPELGGFGYTISGALYNIDTIKYYEVLIAMQKGAILEELRSSSQRRVVWEIGAGWGGFAYQFKRICPNVTYIISDFPELFLFSAVYLMTLFPDARVLFYGDDFTGALPPEAADADFIFIPNTFLDSVTPRRLDLTINMVSFQEMTTEQVHAYVKHAYDLTCPYIYSLNRDRSLYNRQLTSVREIMKHYYWLHETDVLPVSYTQMLDKAPKVVKGKPIPKGANDYRHVIGWRRVVA